MVMQRPSNRMPEALAQSMDLHTVQCGGVLHSFTSKAIRRGIGLSCAREQVELVTRQNRGTGRSDASHMNVAVYAPRAFPTCLSHAVDRRPHVISTACGTYVMQWSRCYTCTDNAATWQEHVLEKVHLYSNIDEITTLFDAAYGEAVQVHLQCTACMVICVCFGSCPTLQQLHMATAAWLVHWLVAGEEILTPVRILRRAFMQLPCLYVEGG